MVRGGPDEQEIRGMLQSDAVWINATTPVDFWASNLNEGQTRFICTLFIGNDGTNTVRISFLKKNEDGTYTHGFGPISVAPADWHQIPKGGHSLRNPVLTLEGGANLAGQIDTAGTSLCVTVDYWDIDV